MRALLALIMRGRTQAMTASAVFASLSLLLPPLGYVSGAVIGLATLKQGPREGALVIAGSVLLAGVFSTLMAGTPLPALAFLALSWLPAWLLAVVLAASRSQGVALLAATALGMVAVVAMHLALDDPGLWWRDKLEALFAPAVSAQAPAEREQVAEQLALVLDAWAPRMTRFFGAAAVVGLVLPLLIARWGHAVLDNPGGFGREFRELRVGRTALGASVALGALALLGGGALGGFAADLMGPVSVMLVLQGLAVAHGVVAARGGSVGWLVATYLLLAIPPHLSVPVLSLAGIADGWLDFRARARGPNGTT